MCCRTGICAFVRGLLFKLCLGYGLVVLLTFNVSAQKTVNLAWDPSTGTNVVGYYVYYGCASRHYTNKFSVGSATTATISGLVEDTTYFFTATAYDATGDESDFSNEAEYYVPSSVISTSSLQSGTFTGLFYNQETVQPQSSGALRLSVTSGGKYSGLLQLSTSRLPFSGQFGFLCQATNSISFKKTNSLTVNFSLTPSNTVVGSVSNTSWMATLYGERTGFHPVTNAAPYPGKYTMVIYGIKSASSSLGNSFGTFTLSTSGAVKFAGTLADGTKVSQSTPVTQFGNWPLYVPLYSGQGFVLAWLSFTNSSTDDLTGTLNWIRPAGTKPLYSGGIAVQRTVGGSRYVLGTNATPNPASISLGGALANSGTNQIISFKFSRANGTFSGRLQNQTAGPVNFQGALLQKVNAGYGYVLGTNLSSPMSLVP